MDNRVYFFIVITALCITTTISAGYNIWQPYSLARVSSVRYDVNIYDPDNYIQSSIELNEMEYFIRKIKSSDNIDILIYLVRNIADNNIQSFINELAHHKLSSYGFGDSNSLIILFAIDHRMNRIRTGSNVKYKLNDYKCQQLLDNLKPVLRDGLYSKAVIKLLTNINRYFEEAHHHSSISANLNENFHNTESNENGYMAYIIIILAIIFPCCYFISWSIKNENKINDQLNKIKNIANKNLSVIDITANYCLICLENLDPVAISNDKIIKAIIKHVCGHCYHKTCLDTWLSSCTQCPICKEDIFNNRDNTSLSKKLVNIQSVIHPSIANLIFEYGENDLIWSKPRTEEHTDNSNEYSSDKGDDSGGASSSW